MTIPESVLEAAASLPETFSAEDLVVAVWTKHPEKFSLHGFPYPDSNKVLSTLMGTRGLVMRGWMQRVGPKRYTLAPEGKEAAEHLRLGAGVGGRKLKLTSMKHRRLLPPEERIIQRLISAPVDADSWASVSNYFGLTGLIGSDVQTRLEAIRDALSLAKELTGKGDQTLSNGTKLTLRQVLDTVQLYYKLRGQYGKHIRLQESRCV